MGSGVERILLGVTGGIAAYKSAEIVRRLKERGAEVQVVMTYWLRPRARTFSRASRMGSPRTS